MLLYPRKTAILESTRPSNQGYLTIVVKQKVPKPGHPWPAWGYYNDQAIALSDFFG